MGGIGGSNGFVSPDLELACGYVTNMMPDHQRDDALIDAIEAFIERR
jgi:hypothetical protein